MLPQGFTRVEWIESTGEQYIDTGFKPNQDTRIVMDCLLTSVPTSNAALFGVRAGSNAEFWTLYRASSSKFTFRYGGSGTNHFIAGSATERHEFDYNGNTMTVDGKSVTVTSETFASIYNAYLFAVNNEAKYTQYHASMRLYRCQIYDNGVAARDYIPCQSNTGEVGLYDMVSATFCANDGTGEFIAGPKNSGTVDANTLLLLHGEDFTDASQYARELTNSGVTVSSAQSKFGGKSLYFNGTTAYLETACLITGKQPFTIDCWAYPTAVRNNTVWSHGGTNEPSVTGGGVEFYGAGNILYFCSAFLVQGGSYTPNRWYHIAIVGDGTNVTIYLDGKSIGTYTGGYNFAIHAETIGANASIYGQENFQGYIDEFRVSNVVRWTEDFTPPSAAYEYDKPAAPQNLAYEINSAGGVELSWDAVTYATKYEIARDGIEIATISETHYTDSEATLGNSHVYVVTPYNRTQAGESAEITVRTALDTPDIPNATLDGETVTLTWGAVSGAEGYKVYRDGAVVASVTSTTYTDTLTPPASVAYAVSAYAGPIQSKISQIVVVENWEGVLLTLITDRTAADVAEAKRLRDKLLAGEALTDEDFARYSAGLRGCYNASDMNRVGAAVRYVAGRLNAEGYGAHVSPKTDWQMEYAVRQSDWNKYLDEVRHLRRKLTLMRTTPQITDGMYSGLKSYAEANAIEQILVDLDIAITCIIRNYIFSGEVFAGEV